MYITKIDQRGLTEVFATNTNGKPVCSADGKSHTPGKRDCRKSYVHDMTSRCSFATVS